MRGKTSAHKGTSEAGTDDQGKKDLRVGVWALDLANRSGVTNNDHRAAALQTQFHHLFFTRDPPDGLDATPVHPWL